MDDVEMTDVAMGLATARPAFAPRSIFDSDAPAAAAGIVASAAAHHHHPADDRVKRRGVCPHLAGQLTGVERPVG